LLHARVSDLNLGIVRVAIFGMWLKHLLGDPLERYLHTPLEFFTPIGPLAWLPDQWWPWLYRAEVLKCAQVVLLIGIAWSMLGLRLYRSVSIATCIGLTLYEAFVRGYGYVYYGELPMLMAAYVLAIYPADRGFSLQRRTLRPAPLDSESPGDESNRAAMLTICMALCFTYTFVGVRRMLNGGIEIYFDHTIVHVIAEHVFRSGVESPGIARIVLEVPALQAVAAVGYAVTTFFELFAPLAIFWRPFRWLWVGAIVGFHVAAGVLMQIWFTANIALIVLCMTNIGENLPKACGTLDRMTLRFRAK